MRTLPNTRRLAVVWAVQKLPYYMLSRFESMGISSRLKTIHGIFHKVVSTCQDDESRRVKYMPMT